MIDTFIDLAEAEMQRKLKLLSFEADATLTVTSGVASLPTGYVAARSLVWLSNPARPLKYLTPHMYEQALAADPDSVSFYTISGSSVKFSDNQTGTARFTYMAQFTPLSGSNTTNFIITNHPGAYLYGSLEHAAAYCKDADAAAAYHAKFAQELEAIKADNQDRKYGGSTLQVRAA